MMGRALLVVLAVLVAGCAGAPSAPSEPEGSATRVSFLHSAMTLADAPEPNASAVRTGAFFQAWAAGDDYPTWTADPLDGDARVTAVNVTLYVTATGPVVESSRFPDIMVYVGSGDAWMGYGERRDLTAFTPGQVSELDIEVTLPQGGLFLPAGEPFGIKVVPVMLQQDDEADVEILLGGDSASSATWTAEPLALPATTTTRGSGAGELTGTIYAGAAAPPTTSHRTDLPIPRDTVFLVAWMNTTDNVGVPDLDLSLVAPNGDVLVTSGTPTPREAIRVALPNLDGPGEYGLVATTAGSPRASFALEWIIGVG